jgi:hypothetical protein
MGLHCHMQTPYVPHLITVMQPSIKLLDFAPLFCCRHEPAKMCPAQKETCHNGVFSFMGLMAVF